MFISLLNGIGIHPSQHLTISINITSYNQSYINKKKHFHLYTSQIKLSGPNHFFFHVCFGRHRFRKVLTLTSYLKLHREFTYSHHHMAVVAHNHHHHHDPNPSLGCKFQMHKCIRVDLGSNLQNSKEAN